MLFNFRNEIHDVYYCITVNVTIPYYSYTCAQYLDVQTKNDMSYGKSGLFICCINGILR